MAVHYPKNLVGRCKRAKLYPVSIAIGIDIQWQGGVTTEEQVELYDMLRRLMRAHPADSLPAAPTAAERIAAIEQRRSNGTPAAIPQHGQTAGRPTPAGKK